MADKHSLSEPTTPPTDYAPTAALPVNDMTPQSETGAQAYGIASDETQRTAPPLRGTRKLTIYRRRFMRNKMAVVGLIIFALLVMLALTGQIISPWAFDEPDFLNLSTAPSTEHWFGTTDSGHDLFTQASHGLGRSLTIAIPVSLLISVLSALIGAGAALYGGWMEKTVLAVIHFMLAVPTFLMIALLVSGSGGDWKVLTVVLVLFGWMYPARVIWSLSLSVRENDYVRAAHFMGVSRSRTLIRHILPNIASLLIIQFMMGLVATIMSETALSFLGLGVKLPDVSLGTLLQVGTSTLGTAPWQFYVPAAILTLLTISMAFIADGLRDALDPNSNSGGKA
ncbi:ABC transporter permease [Corynebacterium timonense]|uniref:Oligopeptide transport system permease protein OppC n=1 Tax=Corynebacterium timonense TaxID=441500 RepID=A0A1H1QI20_9CORY|nr:ABC transporter permease [Corynebacterium timonense]SDS22953.1 peptide/nickel transport system permease protein [Corynebacterium timonense]